MGCFTLTTKYPKTKQRTFPLECIDVRAEQFKETELFMETCRETKHPTRGQIDKSLFKQFSLLRH